MMEILRKTMAALVLLLVVVMLWVGSHVYFESTQVEVDPKVDSFTEQLSSSFDLEVLDEITERTRENFPVAPEVFFNLVERN